MPGTLIVFYSRTGITRDVARQLAARLGADVLAIEDVRPRDGMLGYVRSAMEAMHGSVPDIQPPAIDPQPYDLVVLGTPVWAGHVSSPMRRFLRDHAQELRKVAFFCTMGGSGADSALADMRELAGKDAAATCVFTDHEILRNLHQPALDGFAATLRGAAPRVAAGQFQRSAQRPSASPTVRGHG